MLGKKRKAENAPAEEETDEARRKRLRDQQLKDEVERHNVGDPALSRREGDYAADTLYIYACLHSALRGANRCSTSTQKRRGRVGRKRMIAHRPPSGTATAT